MTESLLDNPYALAPDIVAAAFDRAAATYADAAVVAQVTRNELLDRLDVLTLEPQVVLDAGCADGQALAPLQARYPSAQVIGVDVSSRMLALAAARCQDSGVDAAVERGDLHALERPSGSVDLVFCNLALAWCYDTEGVLAQFRRILKPGGVLHFATFGPDTVAQLRKAWPAGDRDVHVHYFYDMHDIGDALARAGFAEPVMDAEPLTLTYTATGALRRDLKGAGYSNLARGRPRGLGGRGRLAHFEQALAAGRRDGRLPLTYELVYGQAFATERRPNKVLPDGDIAVAFEDLGRRER